MTGILNDGARLLASETARDYAALAVIALSWAEALTSIGAAYAKRMIPLRFMAMAGNALGVLLGAATGNAATLFKHAVNLPLNAARMREMRRLIASVREAQTHDLNIEWLRPFMHPRSARAGERLFSKGDDAHEAYVLVEGHMEIVERGATISPGEIFGEMALFTASGKRTATARCLTDVRVLVITYEQFEQLYFQNPEFGLYLVRLIVRRYEMNSGEGRV